MRESKQNLCTDKACDACLFEAVFLFTKENVGSDSHVRQFLFKQVHFLAWLNPNPGNPDARVPGQTMCVLMHIQAI